MMVSIVIPVFNRAHLISETLDSILAQTYANWECLVVDDGSIDATVAVIATYAERDKRIKLYKRPNSKPKGANACRNIGLDEAKGDYVVFFDSDDLMTENHLEVKVNGVIVSQCDYVITKTQYFNHTNEGVNKYYKFDEFTITPFNYVTQKINWLTCDICIKTSIAQTICFNEKLQSGQEYNYFSKLVHISIKGGFIDEVVTLRRHHENSIRSNLSSNKSLKESFFYAKWYTYLDLKLVADKATLVFLMQSCVRLTYELKDLPITSKTLFLRELIRQYGFIGVYFVPMIVSRKLFGKGYSFRKKLLQGSL